MPSASRSTFSGFSPKALRFLRDLKKNNERAWFQARKGFYESELLAPLQAMTQDLANALGKAKIPIDLDPRRATFRIYRDVRFSPDKSPYKTNLGAYLPYKGIRDAPGGLYVHIEPKESFAAVAFYQLDKERLLRWREAMADDPKQFQNVLRVLERNGVALSEHDTLKRMPRGFEALKESPIERYFRYGSFIVSEKLSDEDVESKTLVDRCVTLAKNAKPLLEYGWRVLMA